MADATPVSYTTWASPPTAKDRLLRWAGAQVWRATGRIARNRADLYGGAAGLRITLFHLTPHEKVETVKRVVEWWRERWPIATPTDVDELLAGRLDVGGQDRLLVTFDDGLASHYDAAVWLASAGVQAVFFVIPSLVDRTIAQWVRFHHERGVDAFPPVPESDVCGVSTSQLREMLAMGHRIGAHNNAHRDLGLLHRPEELRYEIEDGLEIISDLTGGRCQDFAVGFGQPDNLSPEAVEYLRRRCDRVYMCHRGLNVPGRTPLFLLRHAHERGHPLAFARACLRGGADHRLADRIRTMESRVGLLPSVAERALPLAAP